MKTKAFLILILGITAAWLGTAAFGGTAGRAAHCVPRDGEPYCIAHAGTWPTFRIGTPNAYSFFVIGKDGKPVRNFSLAHEKFLHLIVVRKDLGTFQHLHPDLDTETGQFSLAGLALPTDGAYRVFADFTPAGKEKAVVHEDIAAGDSTAYPVTPVLAPKMESDADGYTVHLTANPAAAFDTMATLSFAIAKDGVPVTDLEPYLGAMAHAVLLRNGTLEYVHAHPPETGHAADALERLLPTAFAHGLGSHQTGTVSLRAAFPLSGDYKIFFQIKHKGIVRTFDFVLPVIQGAAPDATGDGSHMNM